MRLTDILSLERIQMPLLAHSKEGTIAELVDRLASNGDILDRDKVLSAVLARETVRTTGIGRGMAIPHGKSEGVGQLVLAIGKSEEGVDFKAADGQPVWLVVLLVSPPAEIGRHIQALARISRFFTLDAFRDELLAAASAEGIFKAVVKWEGVSA